MPFEEQRRHEEVAYRVVVIVSFFEQRQLGSLRVAAATLPADSYCQRDCFPAETSISEGKDAVFFGDNGTRLDGRSKSRGARMTRIRIL